MAKGYDLKAKAKKWFIVLDYVEPPNKYIRLGMYYVETMNKFVTTE